MIPQSVGLRKEISQRTERAKEMVRAGSLALKKEAAQKQKPQLKEEHLQRIVPAGTGVVVHQEPEVTRCLRHSAGENLQVVNQTGEHAHIG